MIENSSENVKRYAPPVQRNRSLNRRKSGEKGNLSGSETEKRLSSLSRNSSGSISDFGDAGITAFPNENFSQSTLVPLEGCSNSEALQFMNDRWLAAMQLCNDPSIGPAEINMTSTEKPVMYSGSTNTSWGPMKLPHQMDFLGELQRAVLGSTNAVPDTSI